MNLSIHSHEVIFESAGCVAGEYTFDNPYKPFFKALRTPNGHNCTLVSPADHRHHRGLMYALKTDEVNFWEEEPGSGHCGVQEVLSTTEVENGFRQTLLWREEQGGFHTYNEVRTITCEPLKNGFEWTWTTRRTSLRTHRLILSTWLLELEGGRKVNYHGLGIRFPWSWCWGGGPNSTVEMNGEPVDYRKASGTTVSSVGFCGQMDGYWSPPTASVTLHQENGFGWFALREGFPYLSVGPSNLEEVQVNQGEEVEETYRILVEDRNPA